MIFAMVGMHDRGFDRLIRVLDAYAAGHPRLDILIQTGSAVTQPEYARFFRFKKDLSDEIAGAELVVSHGSVCVFEALALGKPVVLVPRKKEFGEVIDDHQIVFSQRLAQKYALPVLLDEHELGTVLDEQLRRLKEVSGVSQAPQFSAPQGLCRQISDYLADIAAGRTIK